MKHISAFRNPQVAQALLSQIGEQAKGLPTVRIMEVCGGHTISIFKYGIQGLLPKNTQLLSGPGCPVCVTSALFIDQAIALARTPDTIIATFGDMLRVPGSESSLAAERAAGAEIQICYSTLDALQLAKKRPDKKVVFLGIGFETTAPTIAAAVERARQEEIKNFFVLNALKTMPQALRALVESKDLSVNALICPGHVAAITGLGIFDFLARDHGVPCVVSGFEPLDLLHSISMILAQLQNRQVGATVQNEYARTTPIEGNAIAQQLIHKVFEPSDVDWRGLGKIPGSGLKLNSAYQAFDAELQFPLKLKAARENPACLCGSIMRGSKTPHDCPLFGKVCTPEKPAGACMVSEEGTCATYFKYASKKPEIGKHP